MRQPDYYSILGVEPDATAPQISRAYRTLMRTHHPDVGPAPADQSELLGIMEAFAVLRDPSRRAQYDSRRAGHGRRERVEPEQGNRKPDAGSPEHERRTAGRGQGAARDIPVRHVTPARRQEQSKPADITVTPVRWESGPWA